MCVLKNGMMASIPWSRTVGVVNGKVYLIGSLSEDGGVCKVTDELCSSFPGRDLDDDSRRQSGGCGSRPAVLLEREDLNCPRAIKFASDRLHPQCVLANMVSIVPKRRSARRWRHC